MLGWATVPPIAHTWAWAAQLGNAPAEPTIVPIGDFADLAGRARVFWGGTRFGGVDPLRNSSAAACPTPGTAWRSQCRTAILGSAPPTAQPKRAMPAVLAANPG